MSARLEGRWWVAFKSVESRELDSTGLSWSHRVIPAILLCDEFLVFT
jgi:hypothetical protein